MFPESSGEIQETARHHRQLRITKDGFLLRMKEEDFDQVNVNLKGTFLVTQVSFQVPPLLVQFKCLK